MRFLLLTGLSGSGKTVALRHLEDMGAFCIDNLPPMMMVKFMEACQNLPMKPPLVAMAVDVRSGEFFDPKTVRKVIFEAKEIGYPIDTLYMEASDDVLVNRYKESRRDHPLAGDHVSLREAITQERTMLESLRETANYTIDTSTLRTRSLQKMLSDIFASERNNQYMRLEILSFGFKRGLPREADLVLDVRFLPNPFYIEDLSQQTGLDEPVKRFVLDHPTTVTFMDKVMDLLAFLLPHYQAEGKHRFVIAIGCTGGAHRSVAISEEIARRLQGFDYRIDVTHRDLDLEQAHWKTL
ncbi:MAG: RNase adapter RapZ [Clostridiales bacterium]|nr:RNase adapter RapZ [Clostridiales bacterium]